jgi:hypothetical protein
MSIQINEIIVYTSPSGSVVPSGVWTNDCSPFLRIVEPSGELLRGYSISIVHPGEDDSLEPDYDEITDDPGGAWIRGGEPFSWDTVDEQGWDQGRWNDGTFIRNWWDIETDGVPPEGEN